MSRQSHDRVWNQWNGNDNWVICPSCRKNLMVKDDHSSWEREHIFKMSLVTDFNPEARPNLIAICKDCNTYMFAMGWASKEDYLFSVQDQTSRILEFLSFTMKCGAAIDAGTQCTNTRHSMNSQFCKIHDGEFDVVCARFDKCSRQDFNTFRPARKFTRYIEWE